MAQLVVSMSGVVLGGVVEVVGSNHMTHRLGLIYMYTKYHQNISKGIRVSENTSFPLSSSFKRDNSKGQQGRATILDIDTLP